MNSSVPTSLQIPTGSDPRLKHWASFTRLVVAWGGFMALPTHQRPPFALVRETGLKLTVVGVEG